MPLFSIVMTTAYLYQGHRLSLWTVKIIDFFCVNSLKNPKISLQCMFSLCVTIFYHEDICMYDIWATFVTNSMYCKGYIFLRQNVRAILIHFWIKVQAVIFCTRKNYLLLYVFLLGIRGRVYRPQIRLLCIITLNFAFLYLKGRHFFCVLLRSLYHYHTSCL